MKIIKVISSLSYGGAETQVISLSKELIKQGHQVTIITTTACVPRAHMLDNSGVKLISLNKRTKLDFKLTAQLRKLFIQCQPDIIHAYLYDAEFYSRLASAGLNTPVINSERSDQYQLNLNQRIGNWLTKSLVFGVIANSYSGQNHAKNMYHHLASERFMVVWNGIDLDAIKARVKATHTNYKAKWFGDSSIKMAIMAASIKPEKDYAFALNVAHALITHDPSWRVAFLGEQLFDKNSNYKQSILDQLKAINEANKIRFLGNREDIIEILDQADVSFLTSLHEGFPNTVLESMAVGTPAVTTNFSDIKQILPEPWLVQDKKDKNAFSHAMVRAANMKNQLSKNCIKWVKNNCRIEKATENLVMTYSYFINLYHKPTHHL